MKENDWIVASVNNPDFTPQDFKDVGGMNLDNTQILPYESYVNKPFIVENQQFKDDQGNFSESKFQDFYKSKLQTFSQFASSEPVDNFEYSLFDTSRRPGNRVKDKPFELVNVSNPDRVTTGISGRNVQTNSPFTQSELAQQSKIYDVTQQKYLDYSPNDISLFSNPIAFVKQLFSDPLVKATWDSEDDHIDPITGELVHHYKGQAKLNENGQYYYETLGGRSLIGKEVLHATDIITVDGEGWNKYDFFDSDGLDKSVTGTIMKTLVSVAPLTIPGVGQWYSAALIGREMLKTAPMLYGMVSSLWGNEQDSKFANMLAAYGEQWSSGVSQYSQENTLTFENVGSLIADVALQFGQQQGIQKAIMNLRSGTKATEEASKKAFVMYNLEKQRLLQTEGAEIAAKYAGTDPTKWLESSLGRAMKKSIIDPVSKIAEQQAKVGANLALAYMAAISNTDVYSTLLENGASKRDAALVALGSSLGMFGVDKYLHLGELFFDDATWATERAMRNAFKKGAKDVADSLTADAITNPTKEVSKKGMLGLIKKGVESSKKITNQFIEDLKDHSLGFLGKAVGEGIEETAEELVTDLTKQLYEIAGQFAPNIINQSGITDVGAWDNMAARYGMSFFGGAIGGGLFYGVDAIKKGKFTRDQSKEELLYLVSNGKTQELLQEVDRLEKKGKLGSTKISASRYELDSEGKGVYLTAENEEDSQNAYIARRLREAIMQMDAILNENDAKLSEDQLYDKMVLSERRFTDLQAYLGDVSYITGYQKNFRKLSKQIYEKEMDLRAAYKTEDGTPGGKTLPDAASSAALNNPIRLQNIQKLETELEDLRSQLKEYTSGKQSLPHADKMLFAIDKHLHEPFMNSLTYDMWLKYEKHKNINDLSDAERESFTNEYLTYKKKQQQIDFDQAYEMYKVFRDKAEPHMQELQNGQQEMLKNKEFVEQLIQDPDFQGYTLLGYNERLDEESDEDYEYRDKQKDGETEDEYTKRRNTRVDKINDLNNQSITKLQNAINKILNETGANLDPVTQRMLHSQIMIRKRDVQKKLYNDWFAERESNVKFIEENSENTQYVLNLYKTLHRINPDLTNAQEVAEEFVKNHTDKFERNLRGWNTIYKTLHPAFESLFQKIGYIYTGPFTVKTVKDFLQYLIREVKATKNVTTYKTATGEEKVKYDSELGTKIDAIIPEMWAYLLSFGSDIDAAVYNYDDVISVLFPEFDGEVGEMNWHIIMAQPNNTELIEHSEAELNDIIKEHRDFFREAINNDIESLRNKVMSHPLIKILDDIDSKVVASSPLINFLKQFALEIDPNRRDIETLLQSIYEKTLLAENPADFQLSAEEENGLEEAIRIIKMAQAYLYGAGVDPDYNVPVGHAKVINEFAHNHKEVYPDFKDYATIDQDVALTYIWQLERYLQQIDPDNELSYFNISNINKKDKNAKLKLADKKYTQAKLQFFKVFIDSDTSKFIVNGKSYDLLKGVDKITDEDPEIRLFKLENLFYVNLHNILNEGVSLQDILEQSQLIENIITSDFKKITDQKISDLDEKIDYGKLTEYDKLMYILSIAGISSNEFYNKIKSRLDNSMGDDSKKIVPLTTQEQVSRLALAHFKNVGLFEEVFKYITKDGHWKGAKALSHILFLNGDAGVGKTTVCAKMVADAAPEDILLIAPEKTQVNKLVESVGKGEGLKKNDFLEQIIDQDVISKVKEGVENKTNNEYVTTITLEHTGKSSIINFDKIHFKTLLKIPKLIIIDEITWFNEGELQILEKFASENNITIVGLGNSSQSGSANNIRREHILMPRSIELSISLRDVNLQKSENQQKIKSLIKRFSDSDESDPNYKTYVNSLWKEASGLNLQVYNGNEINGDLITQNFSEELANKLSGDIVFVGDTSGTAYTILKEKFGDKLKVLTESELQGQEFDYIVVDKKWETPDDRSEMSKLIFLQNLYTLISRGKIGSVLIDNNLSNIIGKNKVSTRQYIVPSLREAFNEFAEEKKKTLDKLRLISDDDFNAQIISPSNSPKPQNPPSNGGPNNPLVNPSNGGTNPPPSENETNPPTSQNPSGGNPPSTNPSSGSNPPNSGPSSTLPLLPAKETPDKETQLPIPDAEAEANAKKIIDTVGDTTEEIEKEMEKSITLNPNIPIRVYGVNHFSGLIKNSDGSYTNPKDTIKRDLQIFADSDTVFKDDISRLFSQLLSLKSAILYEDDLNIVPESVKKIISEEAIKNIKYKLVIREVSPEDNFLGASGLSENKLGISVKVRNKNKKLAFFLVGEMIDQKGNTCRITLGNLADPNSIKEGNARNNEQMQYFRKLRSQYQAWIDLVGNNYPDNGSLEIEIPKPQFSGMTYLRKVDTSTGTRKRIQPITLSEFRKKYQGELVISDPYIYTGQSLLDGPTNMRGRAFVLVSADTNLDESQLMDIYIKQKQDLENAADKNPFTSNIKARVRLVALDSIGVSYSSILKQENADLYTIPTKNNEEITPFPFERNYVGTRMYTALWNYRANLQRFLDKYKTFKQDNNLKDEDATNLAVLHDALYDIKTKGNNARAISKMIVTKYERNSSTGNYDIEVSSKYQKYLPKVGLIDKFNKELNNSVREIRLGGSQLDIGSYVGTLTGIEDGNIFYSVGKTRRNIYGIYLTPKAAKEQFNIIDDLLNSLSELVRPIIKDSSGKVSNYPKDRWITSEDGHTNSMRNLTEKLLYGNSIKIDDGENTFTLKGDNLEDTFTHIPVTLTKLIKKVLNGSSGAGWFNYINIESNGTKHRLTIDKIFDYINNAEDKDLANKMVTATLDLALHGTTQEIGSGPVAEDAYFKYGIFVDPSAGTAIEAEGSAVFRKILNNEALFTINVAVDMPVFTIGQTQLNEALNNVINPTSTTVSTKKIPDSVVNLFLNDPRIDSNIVQLAAENSETIEQFIAELNTQLTIETQSIKLVNLRENNYDTILNTKIQYNENTGEATINIETFGTALQKIGIKLEDITNIKGSGDDLEITTETNIYKIRKISITNGISLQSVEVKNNTENVSNKEELAIKEIDKFVKDNEELLDLPIGNRQTLGDIFQDFIEGLASTEPYSLDGVIETLNKIDKNEDMDIEDSDKLIDLINSIEKIKNGCKM